MASSGPLAVHGGVHSDGAVGHVADGALLDPDEVAECGKLQEATQNAIEEFTVLQRELRYEGACCTDYDSTVDEHDKLHPGEATHSWPEILGYGITLCESFRRQVAPGRR